MPFPLKSSLIHMHSKIFFERRKFSYQPILFRNASISTNLLFKSAAPYEKVTFEHMRKAKAKIRLRIIFAQSDLGFCCPLTESLDTVEYTDAQPMPSFDWATSLADLSIFCSHVPEGTHAYSHGQAQMYFPVAYVQKVHWCPTKQLKAK